jgi:hypothetical protein
LPCIIALLLALNAFVQAQDNVAPASTSTPAQSEMQKWIDATDAQWQGAFQRDVTDVHEAEAKKLMLQYLNLLEEAIVKVSKAGDLDGAVALRAEQKRFGDTQLFSEQDEPGDPAAVKQARAAIRGLLAQLEKGRATRAKALHAKYDQVLAQAQAQLTQRQRLDDALLVKAKRDEVAAAWITPTSAATGLASVVQAGKPPAPNNPLSVTKPKVPFGTKPVTEFVIEALVDGNTTLHVTPNSMYWEVDKAAKVGKWHNAKEATYVNGQAWMPDWLPDQGGFQKSQPTEVAFGTIDLEYRLQAITDDRGEKGLLRRTPITAKTQNGEFVVDIPDKEGGAKWYKFLLRPKHR